MTSISQITGETLARRSSSRYGRITPSSANCSGWQPQSGSSSNLLFLCTSVCTGQHRCISPMSSSTRLISGPEDAFYLLAHCRWMSVVHGCPVHRRLSGLSCCCMPVGLLGTLCPNMSRPHPLCLFSEVASRLSSSGVPSHDFYRNFCSACAVTVVIFGHLNRSLLPKLTYLLTLYIFARSKWPTL